MLPLWRNRVCIAISPDHLSLLKLGRGLKPKLLAQYDEAIVPSVKQPAWQTAVDRLAQILTQPEWQNSDADIVLSNRLVRYAVIPSNAMLKKYAEQEAFARHVLTQTYGAISAQWALRIQRGKTAEPWLASAIDRMLLDGLNQACAKNNLRLRSITPYLMPVFNRYRKLFKADSAWLVINEPGFSLFVLISGGAFNAMGSASHSGMSDLSVLLDRENLVGTLSEPCKTVYLHAPAAGDVSAITKAGYDISKLVIAAPAGYPPAATGLYAMAMSGVI